MPTAYQIKDQSTAHYLTFQVVCCLGLFLKNRRHQQLLRIKHQYTVVCTSFVKVWADACEYITENGQQKTLTYLSGPEGVFALHVKNPNGSENIRYIHKDHLGSWNTITDENGNLLQELSYDAWGNRRNPATWVTHHTIGRGAWYFEPTLFFQQPRSMLYRQYVDWDRKTPIIPPRN